MAKSEVHGGRRRFAAPSMRKRHKCGRSARALVALGAAWASLASLPSCVELQVLLGGHVPPENGDDSGSDDGNNDGSGSDGNGNGIPVVELRVSNPTPEADEEVLFTCVQTGGSSEGVTFSFLSPERPLVVDAATGDASYIVVPTDPGNAFTVTCSASNPFGTSAPSNPQVIIASSPPPLPESQDEPLTP